MPVLYLETHSHAILPLSFLATLHLVFLFLSLQVLYGASFILRPLWPLRYGTRPFRQTILHTERRALDIVTEIIPPRFYRSPVPSGAFTHERPLSRQTSPARHGSHLSAEDAYNVLPPIMSQAYFLPRGRTLAPPSLLRENEIPDNYNKHGGPSPIVQGMHNHCGFSRFDGANKAAPPTSCETTGLNMDQVKVLRLAQSTTPKQPYQELEEKNPAIECKPMDVKPVDTEPIEMKCVDANQLNIKSPASSDDELGSSLDVHPPSSSHYPDDSTDLSLSTTRNSKCRSRSSYPGKFPVSEGLELTSLATASHAFREKGTTSVRPFSDY